MDGRLTSPPKGGGEDGQRTPERAWPGSDLMVSMVVDWIDAHPYQAELLTLTLEEMAGIPRDRVVVQCTDRVEEEVVAEFRARGHLVNVMTPYLDRTYCNKIAQLDYFLDDGGGGVGVLLLDLDVAALTPLGVEDPEVIFGKVVDGSNPRLATIQKVLASAGVDQPAVVPCDWEGRGETIATNLNGGVLYIPRRYIAGVRQEWRHWAEWLYGKPDVTDDPAALKHLDQLSFALALAAEGLPQGQLSSNWNFPGGHDRVPQLLNRAEPVRLLHYRSWCLDDGGLIRPAYRGTDVLERPVAQVNAIVGGRRMAFFERFRRDRAWETVASVPLLASDLFSPEFVAREVRAGCCRRLILHGGIPKTGTSSLQWHLAENREELSALGIWFPPPSFSPEPKHQPLSATLRKGDIAGFVAYVDKALRDMPDDTHTVIFTTEGIFNHWWDYPPEAKAALRAAGCTVRLRALPVAAGAGCVRYGPMGAVPAEPARGGPLGQCAGPRCLPRRGDGRRLVSSSSGLPRRRSGDGVAVRQGPGASVAVWGRHGAGILGRVRHRASARATKATQCVAWKTGCCVRTLRQPSFRRRTKPDASAPLCRMVGPSCWVMGRTHSGHG